MVYVKYSFSTPLAWLFNDHTSKVRDIDLCIVKLNWFIELCEFGHIVNYIRRYGKGIKILFGGLFAQLNTVLNYH